MFGGNARRHAKEDQRTGPGSFEGDFDQRSSGCFGHDLPAPSFAPVAGIGRHVPRLVAMQRPPNAACQAKAVAADALHRGLVQIGRAGPCACDGQHGRG